MPIPVTSVDGPDAVAIWTLIVAVVTLVATVSFGYFTLRATLNDYKLTFKAWKDAQDEKAKSPTLFLNFGPQLLSDRLLMKSGIRRVPGSQTRVEFKPRIFVRNTGTKAASDVTVRIILPSGLEQDFLPIEAANPGSVSAAERHEQGRFYFVQHNYNDQREDTLRVGSVPIGGIPIPVGTMELLTDYGKVKEIPWEIRHSDGVTTGVLYLDCE